MRIFKIPKWTRILYPGAVWDFFWRKEKIIYLTFDDGPCQESTEWILNTLEQFNAEATFFCLGENVKNHPSLFQKILQKNHAFGNHGMLHLDGYKTDVSMYLRNVEAATVIIPSPLFRPPYGRIKKSQFDLLKSKGFEIIFWSFLTYDFDTNFDSEKRIKKILANTKPGSILVFHDSVKAYPQLQNELPLLLDIWQKEGYQFKKIVLES